MRKKGVSNFLIFSSTFTLLLGEIYVGFVNIFDTRKSYIDINKIIWTHNNEEN